MLQELDYFTQVTNEPFSLITYHLPWWMLVRLAIKFQPMLETAAGNRFKGLQNMNFCSKNKNLLQAYTFLLPESHTHPLLWRC